MKKYRVTVILDYEIEAESMDMADYQAQLDVDWGTVEDNQLLDKYVYDVVEVR